MNFYWDERYANEQYAYGEEPNVYLKEKLELLKPGKMLFPADGEGRNSVYAARIGWEAHAFDQSKEGRNKALSLATKSGVKIAYQVGEFQSLSFEDSAFDAIALIYAHFSGDQKSIYHQRLNRYLKPGGHIIFEAFSKGHLAYNSQNPRVGGSKDLNMLFSIEELELDFAGFDILELHEQEVELKEGIFHVGKGMVIRFLGRKQ
jgi:SAM-dependent methyltransferase